MFRKSRVSSIMKLTNLLEEFHGTQAEYLDIVNYEIARKIYAVISSYYPEYPKMPNPPKKCRWKAK
jgi:hypothetical protein